MRQFLVLGFATFSTSEAGEVIHLGSNRSEALGVTSTPDEKFARKELHELASPQKRCHFATPVLSESDDDPDDEPDDEPTPMTDSARKLAEERQLTAEQLAEIKPTGATGNIVKGDVEAFLETIKGEDSDDDDDTQDDDEADTVSSESDDDPDDENAEA